MPIRGLTDRGLAFPCIGKIRKGAKKTGNAPGPDLDHFRVEFDEGEQASADIFNDIYGKEPRSINFIFPPHASMEDIASFWLESYTAGRMVARSDGEIYTYVVNPMTGEIEVLNGIDKKTNQPRPYDPDTPCAYYVSPKKKNPVPLHCKPVGRLKIVIPELRRAAWLLALTSSVHDCINLSSQIRAYLTDYGNIANIPFVLKRTPRMISTPDSNDPTKRVRREKWLLSIEVNPAWFGRMLDHRQEQISQLMAPKGYGAEPIGLNTKGWDELPITVDEEDDLEPEDDNGMDQVAPAPEFGVEEGEFEEVGKEGQYSDLEFLSQKDPVTAYWHLAKRIGYSKEDAAAIVKECGNDFGKAFAALLKQAP